MSLLVGIRIVPDAKITRYLLDPEHAVGGPKARFFMAFGFQRDHPETLVSALLLHASAHPVSRVVARTGGTNRVITGPLQTPDRRDPAVTSVWFQAESELLHRLVTAYPAQA